MGFLTCRSNDCGGTGGSGNSRGGGRGRGSRSGLYIVSFEDWKGVNLGRRTHAAAPEDGEGLGALGALLAPEMPATAAVISAAVASSTRRFCEIMHPTGSFSTSQVLPLPVLSLS